jgi:thiamine kinase-like enzyme
VAHECGKLAHPFAQDDTSGSFSKYKTFTHGDPKQSNFLFKQTGSGVEVGLIDFQWAGFGLAATDVAHFLSAAVHADRLVDGGETSLLRYYFHNLQLFLVEFGAFPSVDDVNKHFDYDEFLQQYETGVLDLCRLVIAYAWTRFEPVGESDDYGREKTMNKNSYNKCMKNVVWLMSRCDDILVSRGL